MMPGKYQQRRFPYSRTTKIDALKETLEVYKTEYVSLSAAVQKTLDFRRQIVSYSLLASGGAVPLVIGYIQKQISAEAFLYLLLFIPIVFAGACLAYAGQDYGEGRAAFLYC